MLLQIIGYFFGVVLTWDRYTYCRIIRTTLQIRSQVTLQIGQKSSFGFEIKQQGLDAPHTNRTREKSCTGNSVIMQRKRSLSQSLPLLFGFGCLHCSFTWLLNSFVYEAGERRGGCGADVSMSWLSGFGWQQPAGRWVAGSKAESQKPGTSAMKL